MEIDPIESLTYLLGSTLLVTKFTRAIGVLRILESKDQDAATKALYFENKDLPFSQFLEGNTLNLFENKYGKLVRGFFQTSKDQITQQPLADVEGHLSDSGAKILRSSAWDQFQNPLKEDLRL